MPRKKRTTRVQKKVPTRPSGKSTTIDEYLSQLGGEHRRALDELRRVLRALLPGAEECISYGMPAYRLEGRIVAGFAATSKGGSYYPFSGSTLAHLASELEGYSSTKSALHFTLQSPLPRALVRKLVKARLAEG